MRGYDDRYDDIDWNSGSMFKEDPVELSLNDMCSTIILSIKRLQNLQKELQAAGVDYDLIKNIQRIHTNLSTDYSIFVKTLNNAIDSTPSLYN